MGEIPGLPIAGLVHALTVDVSQPESCWRRRDLRAQPTVSSQIKDNGKIARPVAISGSVVSKSGSQVLAPVTNKAAWAVLKVCS